MLENPSFQLQRRRKSHEYENHQDFEQLFRGSRASSSNYRFRANGIKNSTMLTIIDRYVLYLIFFDSKLLLHLNGISVPVEYYENIKNSLFDDYERVRMLSTQLICLLAYSYPE